MFFRLLPKNAYLSDLNPHIISAYISVRDNPFELINKLEEYSARHCKTFYLEMRDKFNNSKNHLEIGSLFIYLNKTSFNALYRVNKSGKSNVPYNKAKPPKIFDAPNLYAASQALQTVAISEKSFTQINPRKDAFYYLDPPYHGTWSGYTKEGFTEEDHKKLAVKVREIDEAGGYFLLSNSNTDFIVNLYKDFNVHEVVNTRSCHSDIAKRGKFKELLIRNYS